MMPHLARGAVLPSQRMSTITRLSALGLSGLVALGCVELPDIHWRGEHVDFAAERPELVCAGTRTYLDRRTGQLLERLGSEPRRIEYYLLDELDEVCGPDDGLGGCAGQGVVYSKIIPHLHEIVHTWRRISAILIESGTWNRASGCSSC